MSFLGTTYVLDKNENFKEYLDTLPIPPEKAQAWLNSKPTSKIEKDGDTYIVTSTTFTGEPRVTKFQSGVEFDENIDESISSKSTYTVDGNVVTHVQKFPDGNSLTFKREYQGKDLVVTLTTSKWDGTAKRYYVAV